MRKNNIHDLAEWIWARAYSSTAWVPARSPNTRLAIAVAGVGTIYNCVGTAFLYWIDYHNIRTKREASLASREQLKRYLEEHEKQNGLKGENSG